MNLLQEKIVEETYKINFKYQFYSIKNGLILLAISPIGLALAYWTDKISLDDFPDVLVVILLFNLVFFLPAFFLHFTYFLENRKTILKVDNISKRFSITEGNNTFDFALDDIQLVEQHLGIYYKDKNRGRKYAPWSDYGYLKLKIKNGQIYFLSSLMLDLPIPPFPISLTKYRLMPLIEKQELTVIDKRNLIELEREEKINNYIEKFADLPKENLQNKLDNSKKYEPEAVAASKILIARFNNQATSVD